MLFSFVYLATTFDLLATAQQIARDAGVAGPPLEIIHLYNDEFPTGIAVSAAGRKFSNYPPSLDANNIHYTVAELIGNTMEIPYPSAEINSPPGGRINQTTIPPTGANYQNYLVGAQIVVIDPKDRLWILDTGRASTSDGINVPSSFGGPKLVGVNLTTNAVFQTIVFPPNVAYDVSYPNDVRFDLRPSITASGQGIAYISDSSTEGRSGIIVADLGTGQSWRHLDGLPEVHAQPQFVPFIWGEVVYTNSPHGTPLSYLTLGANGIALSADGETLYFAPTSDRYLYSIPTVRLRDNTITSELLAQAAVSRVAQKGVSDGLETDSNGLIYIGNNEDNAINTFNPENGTISVYVRDPKIGWTDSMSVSGNHLYFTQNQLWRTPDLQGGVDKRIKPYVLYRVPLVGNGAKTNLQ